MPTLSPKPDNGIFSRSQKRELFALSGLTIIIILFAILQMRHNINAPFDNPASASKSAQTLNPISSDTAAVQPGYVREPDGTVAVDTDHDGLSDQDEVNIYKTSPYLPDSDGDGIPDGTEVQNGTDPNCPTGQNCSNSASLSVPASDTTTTDASSGSASSVVNPISDATSSLSVNNEAVLQNVLTGKSDPAVLRKLLLDNGMDKTQLDMISDQDLINSYQETLNQSQAASSTAPGL
jgi:hypothetical protein